MFKAEFELEAITPIFMRGVNQSRAEIRSSSIKGLMRWWFRALAGNYFGNDVVNLRKAEESIFGSTGQRSRVVVEVSKVESNIAWNERNEYERYFWFSQVGRYSKPAIHPNSRIRLVIKSYDKRLLKISLISLWMTIHLGGFGSRSRKFGGSIFPVKEPETNFEIDINFLPSNIGNLKEYYVKTLSMLIDMTKEILQRLGFKEGKKIIGIPSYPIFSNGTVNVFIGIPVDKFSEAIRQIGEWYLGEIRGRKFEGGFRFKYADRKIVQRIYQKYKQGLTNISNIAAHNERRPYLGLPIQFYKKFNNEFVRFTVDHWYADRRASSLIMTVNKCDGKYYPVITVFRYTFLPKYTGPVRYSGGVFRNRSKLADARGALFILKKGENPDEEYHKFYNELIKELRNSFEEVFS